MTYAEKALAMAKEEARQAYNQGVHDAAEKIRVHSCVSSCCNAQPSAGEAEELAKCVLKLRIGP